MICLNKKFVDEKKTILYITYQQDFLHTMNRRVDCRQFSQRAWDSESMYELRQLKVIYEWLRQPNGKF